MINNIPRSCDKCYKSGTGWGGCIHYIMGKGTKPKTERNKMIVELRDRKVKRGEKQLSFAEIGKQMKPKLTAQRVHEIYVREKKRGSFYMKCNDCGKEGFYKIGGYIGRCECGSYNTKVKMF